MESDLTQNKQIHGKLLSLPNTILQNSQNVLYWYWYWCCRAIEHYASHKTSCVYANKSCIDRSRDECAKQTSGFIASSLSREAVQ